MISDKSDMFEYYIYIYMINCGGIYWDSYSASRNSY